MARTVLPIAGALVGTFFGAPQLGFMAGSIIAAAIPTHTKGPRIGETGAQTSQEGAPRAIVRGTAEVTGNVICSGPLITGYIDDDSGGGKGGNTNQSEHCYRTYAIRICEGPISQVLRIWEDDKCVYDIRPNDGGIPAYYQSLMNEKWIFGCGIYYGTEDQLPDPFLQINVTADMPAYRGTAYMVFVFRDLTDRRGSIPQYRFEVARDTVQYLGGVAAGPVNTNSGRKIALNANSSGQFVMLEGQTGVGPGFVVDYPGSFDLNSWDSPIWLNGASPNGSMTVSNSGDANGDPRMYPIGFDTENNIFLGYDANYGFCKMYALGTWLGNMIPSLAVAGTGWYFPSDTRAVCSSYCWFANNSVYLGVPRSGSGPTNWNRIMRFPPGGSRISETLPLATALNVSATPGAIFLMHVDRTSGVVRAIDSVTPGGAVKKWDASLSPLVGESIPASINSRIVTSGASGIYGFGCDDALRYQCFVFWDGTNSTMHAQVFDYTGALKGDYVLDGAVNSSSDCRVVFTKDAIGLQVDRITYRVDAPLTYAGVPVPLSAIVAEIHDRCGVPTWAYDVSELTDDLVTGVVFAGDYTGADAIDTLRSCYFFDKAEYDKKLWYPKRGAPVVASLTVNDMVEVPDESQREQAVEFPRKLHLQYQNADAAYAAAIATTARSSPDSRVVGESTVQVPVVLNVDQAAQLSDKMLKVAWKEAEGEIKFSMPLSAIKYVPSNNFGVTIRGRTYRERLEKAEYADGVISWTLKHDRQSAYTSNVTGIPIPPPTAPPSTLVGDTEFVFLDISPRQASEDNLNYLVAVGGSMDGWYGASVQCSADGGATFAEVARSGKSARIGALVNAIPSASSHYTDRTNIVTVQLFKPTQTLDSISDVQFNSQGGAFALQKADGTYEVMQYRDSTDLGGGKFALSTLKHGQLNSGAAAHAVGALFVMLADAIHVDAPTAWIGQTLTHRAVSYEQSPEEAALKTNVFTAKSQTEWPPASLSLVRDASNVVTGTWFARGRFGSDDAPINSTNLTGWRITLVGSSTVTFDQALNGTGTGQQSFSYDASALGTVTVSVQALNRITGPATAATGTI